MMFWRLMISFLSCVSFWVAVDGFKYLPYYHCASYCSSHFQENVQTPFTKNKYVSLFSSESSPESATRSSPPWLEGATNNFIHQRPTGSLNMQDVKEAKNLMSAWAKRGEPLPVELLLKRIIDDQNSGSKVRLLTQHYSIAMNAWAKSGIEGSAERAQAIHDKIVQMYNETKNSDLAPTVISYSTLISAWIRQDHKRGIEQAERTFEEMKEAWLSGGNELVKPDASTISQLLNGYSKSVAFSTSVDYTKEQVERAQVLFNNMTEWNITKTIYCYVALQNVHAQSRLPEAPFRAMELLEDLMNETTTIAESTISSGESGEAEDDIEIYDNYLSTNLDVKNDDILYTDDPGDSNILPVRERGNYDISTPDRKGSPEVGSSMNSDHDNENSTLLRPTIINFNTVFNACSKSVSLESCYLARDLLKMMPSKYGIEPVQISYILALQACVLFSSPNSKNKTAYSDECAKVAVDIFYQLEQAAERQWQRLSPVNEVSIFTDSSHFHDSNGPARVTHVAYNKVLTVLSRVADLQSIDQMEKLVQQMEGKAFSSDSVQAGAAMPTRRTYNSILNALCHMKLPYAEKDEVKTRLGQVAEKGTKLLDHMWNISTFFNTTDDDAIENKEHWSFWCRPDSYTYTAVLRLYQRSVLHGAGGIEAAKCVDNLVRQMETLYDQGKIGHPPDVVHYTIAIASWAQAARQRRGSNRPQNTKGSISVHRCAQLLSHMMERHKAGYSNCVPNVRTYNHYLDALATGHYFEEAESLLYHMLHQYNFVYKRKNNDMAPDTFSFNAVIIAMTRSASSRHVHERNLHYDRTEAILDRLLEYCANENPKVIPDERSFSILINHYTSHRGGRKNHALADRYNPDERPYRAEAVLDRMVDWDGKITAESGLSSTQYFLKVMDTFASYNVPDGGKRAERLLQSMKDLNSRNNSTFTVDANIVCHVMSAWAHSSHPQAAPRVEQYLDALEKRAIQPTVKCYEIVLKAWTRSQLVDIKAPRALAALQRFLRNYQNLRSGNATTYYKTDIAYCKSLVINACGFVSISNRTQQAEAFPIAANIMKEVIDDGSALSVSYGWFLQLCNRFNSIPLSERLEQAEYAFRDGCRRGLVNGFVWDKFVAVATPDLMQSIVKDTDHKDFNEIKSYLDLPKSWRSHLLTNRNRNR